jgi:uncharacterized SAM-binding protein YcdF (DUF218 family)
MNLLKLKNKDLPAFACVAMSGDNGYQQDGLTKREYFAGLAMQGLLTRVPYRHNGETDLGVLESQRIAEEAVIMADKLLNQLENNFFNTTK